jgi:hypothetical protein
VTVGAAVFAGGAAVTATWAELAAAEPLPFVAVTVTRTLVPMSAGPSVYVVAVAPVIGAHAGVQRSHCEAYAIGCVPVHVPSPAVSFEPSRGVPVTVGTEVFAGGVGGAAGPVR